MSPEKISEILKNLVTCPDDIPDNQLGRDFNTLLNLLEKIFEDYKKIKEENQQLRDALNLLKGEDPKPKFPEKKKKKKDESSEKERKDREPPKKKESKKIK